MNRDQKTKEEKKKEKEKENRGGKIRNEESVVIADG